MNVESEARYLVHVETNGRREPGFVLLRRREAVELVLADAARHSEDGWCVEEFHDVGGSGFVMTDGSAVRRVWREQVDSAQETSPGERDLRHALADGFRYPGRVAG